MIFEILFSIIGFLFMILVIACLLACILAFVIFGLDVFEDRCKRNKKDKKLNKK